MGTKVYVSSVVYNLAGDINNRPDYLKTTVAGAIVGQKASIPDTLHNAYMQGPGLRLKNFAHWARTQGYSTQVGLNAGTFISGHSVDEAVLTTQIPHDPGSVIEFQSTLIDDADYTYWADQHVADTKPSQWGTDYLSSYNEAANLISIGYVDGTEDSFMPENFDPYGSYLYAVYTLDGAPKVFIYKKDSGNPTLDDMWDQPAFFGWFYPFIPYRIDNKSVATQYPNTIYPASKKALKKALNADYDEILKKLNESESIGDIDYAYVTFGACLNTKENASKKYIYKFFDKIRESNPTTKSVTIASNSNTVMNYNMTISWSSMTEETGSGKFKPDAVTGEVNITCNTGATEGGMFGELYAAAAVTTLEWQVGTNQWKRLRITGLQHRNLIYKGNAVKIWANDALVDADESGFIIPLHEDIYKSMSIKDFTQMSTACCYIVFNCYQVVKTHWWQSWWFQILIVVAVVVISIFTFGLGAVATMGGLLGSNAVVGAAIVGALGMSLACAIVVAIGAIVNALAAMILVMIISRVSGAVFGSKIGAILGAIGSFVTLSAASGLANGKSFASIFRNLLSAQNLIGLTNAIGNGLTKYWNASAQDIMEDIADYQKQNEQDLKAVEDKRLQEFGYGAGGVIDPMEFIDAAQSTQQFNSMVEPLSLFLSRTLMTGSDVAELSIEMLHSFASLTLNTNLLLAE